MPYLIFGAALLLIATLLLSYITFKIPFGRGKYLTDPYETRSETAKANKDVMYRNIDFLLSHECEEVSITARDGTVLFADYYHVCDGAPIEIQAHGYRSMGAHDFSGGAKEAIERGHNLLLIDQRAHRRSGGRAITFGALESDDVIKWAEYLVRRFGEGIRILLLGISMGAATVLIASGHDMPREVRGIIADCPCSDAWDIVSLVGRKKGAPMWLIKPFLTLGARLFGGFNIKDTDVCQAVKHARVPILLIHGEADDFVPLFMSEKIKAANERITLVTFPGARHGESYLTDTERYRKICNEFKDKVLK